MLRFLRLFNNGRDAEEEIPGVVPRQEFRRALERERSRADRTGSPLSLVVIWDTSGLGRRATSAKRNPMLPSLARILIKRVRCTDIIGWFEEGKLGVVLPHTPGKEAWNLADDVDSASKKSLGDEDLNSISYRVHTYPFGEQPQAPNCHQVPLFADAAAANPSRRSKGKTQTVRT